MSSTKLNLNDVMYSIKDKSRGITIPSKSSEDLAELIGTLMGDGHLGIYKDKQRKGKECRYQLNISGHMTDDLHYYNYIDNKFKSIFNVSLNIWKWKERNALVVTLGSKAILTFFRGIGFPIGNKNNNATIPSIIKKGSIGEKSSFLKGLADTDFSLTFKERKKTKHSYPVIKGIFKSKILVSNLTELLSDLNLYHRSLTEIRYEKRWKVWVTQYAVYIRGKKHLADWMDKVGFKNPKHTTKYEIWKRFGFCPPYTSLKQRLQILNGEFNPSDLY